jgi:hypothetical protein
MKCEASFFQTFRVEMDMEIDVEQAIQEANPLAHTMP